ncbi:MAG: 5-formyltetrahydrofolate cyclo-ligase [Myxococcota bacterium]
MENKAALRRELRTWRRQLDPRVRNAGFAQAIEHLLALDVWASAHTVALYAALPTEPDLTPLMRDAHNRGVRVALPVVMERNAPLHWRAYERGATLVPGAFSVPEPPTDAPALDPHTFDLVVVPALAVDDRGYRLGYGGGYYDRSLPLMPTATRIWLGLDAQRRARLPTEPTDRAVHLCITESGATTVPPNPA